MSLTKVFLLAALMLTCCAMSRRIEHVRIVMSQHEVMELLGEPYSFEFTVPVSSSSEAILYYRRKRTKRLYKLFFYGDRFSGFKEVSTLIDSSKKTFGAQYVTATRIKTAKRFKKEKPIE